MRCTDAIAVYIMERVLPATVNVGPSSPVPVIASIQIAAIIRVAVTS